MKALKNITALLAVLVLASGCASKGGVEGAGSGVEGEEGGGANAQGIYDNGQITGVETQGIGAGGEFAGDPLSDPRSPLSKRVIYFMFDSSEVQPEYRDVVAAHAAYLVAHPQVSVVLEGHADERGTREYNIALGEQRGNGVARMLKLQGVDASQLQVVSYGEEKPTALDHDEASWSVNRRVEIVYRGH